jgi:hypothetical protein
MKFTIEKETDNDINFLDITTLKEAENLSFDTYRKPTTTDTIILNDSCHPLEHKLAAINYLANRMETYNLNSINKEKGNSTIKQILYNNKHDISILNRFTTTGNKNKHNTSKTKRAKFTYIGKETTFITKLFNNTSLKNTFTTQNTIGKLLSIKQNPNQEKFDKGGVYQLTCPDCNMKYIGQIDRPFHVRFQEHTQITNQNLPNTYLIIDIPLDP